MSLLPRILRPAQTQSRTYSSFFSSKPGGGRYFNSSKPPKPVVNTGRGKVDNAPHGVAVNDGANGSGSSGSGNANGKLKVGGAEENSSAQTSVPVAKAGDTSSQSTRIGTNNASSKPFSQLPQALSSSLPNHPAVSSQDYKLHQFFSLHRPLLLLSHPPSIIFETPERSPLFSSTPEIDEKTPLFSSELKMFDDPPESSIESDADAARQLAHTMVMNRVGSVISWQDTLSKLGLDIEGREQRELSAKEMAEDWATINADSTRRKRRKKMKKHKLKKRRRLSRQQVKS
ncbi:hypothetical protein BJ138DRAFT_1128568 [Hygrophoropsis aurantiaca]|uniref:Uncharacterized protein n=1 Tax=Hygrophoropsis aurantiaca TaxID=72124 RepID=A0ACB8A6K8_9AGAM|nr:hypothetical protein BJ138DRAFT_1128568 [Hygrophoropsis aurantiaca]